MNINQWDRRGKAFTKEEWDEIQVKLKQFCLDVKRRGGIFNYAKIEAKKEKALLRKKGLDQKA